jgi:hypothetical protein
VGLLFFPPPLFLSLFKIPAMKNLLITSDCAVQGQHVAAGTILEHVDNAIAADLLVSGRAVLATATDPAIQLREPEVETRDPKPARKTRRSPSA